MASIFKLLVLLIALTFAGIATVAHLIFKAITMTFALIVIGFFAVMAIFFTVEERYLNKDR